MSIEPENLESLVRSICHDLTSGGRDYAAYRSWIFKLEETINDERLYHIEDDIDILDKLGQNADVGNVLPTLWLFSPEAAALLAGGSAPHAEEVIFTQEAPPSSSEEWIIPDWEEDESSTGVDTRSPTLADDDTKPTNQNGHGANPPNRPLVYDRSFEEERVPQEPTYVSEAPILANSVYDILFNRLEQVLQAQTPDFVAALVELETIRSPSESLTPPQLERFRNLRSELERRRREEQEHRRQAAFAAFDEPRYSLEEVVSFLDTLLDPKVTRDYEEGETRAQRTTLTAPDWSLTKSERYLIYFEHHYKRVTPNLNERYEWLRAQQTQLDGIASAPTTNVTYRAKQLSAQVKSETDQLAVTLNRIASRTLGFAYVETLLDLDKLDPNAIVEDEGKPIRVEDLIQKVTREYAENTFRRAKDSFVTLLGNDAALKALSAGLRKEAVDEYLRFDARLSDADISKQTKLGLINLYPTVYQAQFPEIPVEGDRSLDPDPASLKDQEFQQFVLLRDTFLPKLLTLYNQIVSADANDLASMYDVLSIWAHPTISQPAETLEKQTFQALDGKRTEHQVLYDSNDFWDYYFEEKEFEDYLTGQIATLESQPLQKIELSRTHPYYAHLQGLKKEVAGRIAAFEALRGIRSRLIAELEFLQKQLTRVEERLKKQEDPSAIEQTLDSLRRRAEKMSETYHFRIADLIGQINQISRDNDARRGSQQIVEEAETLFDLARTSERDSDAADLFGLWQSVVSKTSRFKGYPEDGEPSALRGHLLHLYAQAKSALYHAQTLPVEKSAERTRETYKAQNFYDQFNGIIDGTSLEVRRILPAAYVRELGETIKVQAEHAEITEQNQGKIERMRRNLFSLLDRATFKLQVYIDYGETILREIANPQSDDDYRETVKGYYEGGFAEQFDLELKNALDDFMSTVPPVYEKGHPIYAAFEWADEHKLTMLKSKTLSQRFQTEYRKIAESAYQQIHENAQRQREHPFDLPLSVSEYEHWFQIRTYGVSRGFVNSEEARKTAVIAAYYLLATATENGKGNIKLVESYIDLILGGTEEFELKDTDRRALARVRERACDYIIRDAIAFAYASYLYLISQRDDRLTDEMLAADTLAQSARTQVDMLKQSGSGSARMIGEMWTQRLDALEQFARRDFTRTGRILRDFNRTSRLQPDENDTDWARRRFTEMNGAMDELYQRLELVVKKGIDFNIPARDARELKERLGVAIFYLEAQTEQFKQRGRNILAQLGQEGSLAKIHQQINDEFENAITQKLPASVGEAEETISALRDDLERTNSELRAARIDENMINNFKLLFDRLDETHGNLSRARKIINDGVEALENVVLNLNGVNAQDDWNTDTLSTDRSQAEDEINNAIYASGYVFEALTKGKDDFVPFDTAIRETISKIGEIRSKRKSVREKLKLSPAAPNDPVGHFKGLIADIREVRDAQIALSQVLNANYPRTRIRDSAVVLP